MVTPNLLSLEEAKAQLRIRNSDHDYDILLKIAEASRIVLDYAKLQTVPAEWLIGSPATTVEPPENFRMVTKAVLSEIFENREASTFNIPDAVWRLVERPPTLA